MVNVLVVQRSDLNRVSQRVNISNIGMNNLSFECRAKFKSADMVIFYDTDGQNRLLKSRD